MLAPGEQVMQQIRLALSAILLLLSLRASDADVSDFSGVWQMDPSRSESAHQAVPIGPVTLVIKQKAAEVSIETRRGQNHERGISSETLTYPLDGSESSTVGTSGVQIKAKAHWEGAKLITETERNVQGSTVTTVHVFSLDAGGKELKVDKTLTVQHGYQFEGASNTGTGKDVFIKSRVSIRK
jgi:hypothetical protein